MYGIMLCRGKGEGVAEERERERETLDRDGRARDTYGDAG